MLQPSGHLADAKAISKLRNQIRKCKDNVVVLNCLNLNFVDSYGIGMIIFSHQELKAEGRELNLYKPNGLFLELIKSSNLDKILIITGD